MLDYERDILRHLGGEDVPGLIWGAAMSECLGSLYAQGYVCQRRAEGGIRYEITDAGRTALHNRS